MAKLERISLPAPDPWPEPPGSEVSTPHILNARLAEYLMTLPIEDALRVWVWCRDHNWC